MNTLHTIYLLSTTGAAVFYATGYFTKALLRSKQEPKLQAAAPQLQQVSSAELCALQNQLDAARLEAEQSTNSLNVANSQKSSLQRKAEEEIKTRANLEHEKADLEFRLRQAQQAVQQAESRNDAAARELREELDQERSARLGALAELDSYRKSGAASSTTAEVPSADKISEATRSISELRQQIDRLHAESRKDKQRIQTLDQQLAEVRKAAQAAEAKAKSAKQFEVALAAAATAKTKLHHDLGQARTQVAALQSKIGKLEQQALSGADASREVERLRNEAQHARQKYQALSLDNDKLRQERENQNRKEQLRQQSVALRTQLSASAGAQSELSSLRARLRQTNVELEAARRRAEAADAIQNELDELKQRVALGGDVDALRREVDESRLDARQLRIDAKVAADRIDSLKEAADKVVELRQRVLRLEGIEEENAALKAQIRSLESRALVTAPAFTARNRPSHRPGPRIDDGLARLLSVKTMRSAVVADTMGLLVSAVGEPAYHEGMGAMAGVISQVVDRATDLLPLAALRSIHLTDVNDVVVSCGLVQWMQDQVVLVTLSSGMPEPKVLDKTLASIAAMGPEPGARSPE